MFDCPACGSKVALDADFCPNCGKKKPAETSAAWIVVALLGLGLWFGLTEFNNLSSHRDGSDVSDAPMHQVNDLIPEPNGNSFIESNLNEVPKKVVEVLGFKADDRLNVRAGPNVSFSIISTMELNARAHVNRCQGSIDFREWWSESVRGRRPEAVWCEISSEDGEQVGWVNAQFLRPTGSLLSGTNRGISFTGEFDSAGFHVLTYDSRPSSVIKPQVFNWYALNCETKQIGFGGSFSTDLNAIHQMQKQQTSVILENFSELIPNRNESDALLDYFC